MQAIKDQNNQIFNTLALDILIKEKDPVLRNKLRNIINETVQGINKITKAEYNGNSLELFLQKDEKDQYLKLYPNGDYAYFSDVFN